MKRTLIVYARDSQDWANDSRIDAFRDRVPALYQALCADALMLATALNGIRPIWASYSTSLADEVTASIDTLLLKQKNWDGINEAFSRVLTNTAQPTVMLTTDTPHLPLNRLRDAFTRLEDGADLVIGPAEDGTVYLIGVKQPWPLLFQSMPQQLEQWARTLQQRASDHSLRLVRLPGWYRINGFDDLYRLNDDLRMMPPNVAVHTRAFLANGLDKAQALGA